MIVELQCGDSIAIPNGCKAIVNGNEVVIEKEEKEFKRGDVIVSKKNEILLVDVHCFENRILRSFVHIQQDGTLFNSSYSLWNELHTWRLATEEEKQFLFDEMKEQGLRWNADKKCIEQFRWRAELGERYYFFDEFLEVQFTIEDETEDNDIYWGIGNYFKTKEDAESALLKVKELLKNKKLQNG